VRSIPLFHRVYALERRDANHPRARVAPTRVQDRAFRARVQPDRQETPMKSRPARFGFPLGFRRSRENFDPLENPVVRLLRPPPPPPPLSKERSGALRATEFIIAVRDYPRGGGLFRLFRSRGLSFSLGAPSGSPAEKCRRKGRFFAQPSRTLATRYAQLRTFSGRGRRAEKRPAGRESTMKLKWRKRITE